MKIAKRGKTYLTNDEAMHILRTFKKSDANYGYMMVRVNVNLFIIWETKEAYERDRRN